MRGLALCLCFMLLSLLSMAQSQLPVTEPRRELNLMPQPAAYQLGAGHLMIAPSFSVALTGYKEPRLERAVRNFVDRLSRQTGSPLSAKVGRTAGATLTLHVDHASKEIQELGEDESYTLNISPTNALLTAPTPLGALRGLETFLQLVEMTPDGFAAPAVAIQDKPRFPWRGLMIDVSRHFMPLDVIKRNLDGMAAAKLNVMHWHLSDNQGFRVECKRFPKLHQMGSDGLYYTQQQIRSVIAYARDRGIRVVPEFDMPGHTTAWFVGYPELASAPGPYTIERRWGVFDPAMDPTRETTYKFLEEFIAEMAQLFPDRYFHIGGDEVNGKQWSANPKIQHYMQANGIKDNQALQAYFNKRVRQIVVRQGKIMMGWDEILDPALPKSAVIQSWRGQKSVAEAAKQGYNVLLSSGYYLDRIWPASRHYEVDPLGDAAADLTPKENARVLGGEACMWSEYVSPETIDSRIWPRMGAIAERFWSPRELQNAGSMYKRMEKFSRNLEWLGLTHHSSYLPMLQRLAGRDDVSALKVLADVVEPVKDYQRHRTAPTEPTSATPLNRLIDTVRPESDTARHFDSLVNSLFSGKPTKPETRIEIRGQLTEWRDSQESLQPLLQRSVLLKEVAPLSQNLSALGVAGLGALDCIENHDPAPDGWRANQLALIDRAKKPTAQVLLMVAPSVQKLVEACGAPTNATSAQTGTGSGRN